MDHYTVEDGLPSTEVYDIIQDDYGYLWFSTDRGLSRYNGYTFENFGVKEGLTDNTVFNFFKRGNGEIWCNTFNHRLFYFQGATPDFIPFKFNDELCERIPPSRIDHEIYVKADGTILLAYANGDGYTEVTPGGEIRLHEQNEVTSGGFIKMILDGENKAICFISNDSVCANDHICTDWCNFIPEGIRSVYLSDSRTSVFLYYGGLLLKNRAGPFRNLSFEEEMVSLGKWDKEHFWVGFRTGGVRVFDYTGKQIYHFLKGKTVTQSFQDHEGAYWFATHSSGVYKVRNPLIKVISTGLDDESVHSLTHDSAGHLLVGYYQGVLSKREGRKLRKVHTAEYRKPIKVHSLGKRTFFNSPNDGFFEYVDGEGRYFHSGLQLTWEAVGDSLIFGSYNSISSWSEERGWGGTVALGNRSISICKLGAQVFVGTKTGLCLWTGRKLEPVHRDIELCRGRIDVLEKIGEKLLVGTRGRGMCILSDGGEFRIIDRATGLGSNFVNAIHVDEERYIWVATSGGLSRINLNGEEAVIKNMSYDDGLPGSNVTDVEVHRDTVWVGTNKGLCYFPRKLFDRASPNTETYLRFEDMLVNDEKLVFPEGHYFSSNQTRFEFHFLGISFGLGRPLNYRYRLEGGDRNWTYTTGRKALYTTVPAGEYNFVVQIRNNAGEWDEEISYNFTVPPPFWATWWFRSAVLLSIGLLIYLFFRFNVLSYNRDVTRELLRYMLKRVKGRSQFLIIREQGKDLKIETNKIRYVKSEGNYLEIHTDNGKHVIRAKIGDFMEMVPDPIEFLRVHRSYIIRLDKVQGKGVREVIIADEEIPVGKTYVGKLKNVKLVMS